MEIQSGRQPRSVRVVWIVFLLVVQTVGPVTGAADRAPACQITNGTPIACNCNSGSDGFIIECNNNRLTRVPFNIPENTTVLNLATNAITRIGKGDLSKLENMRTLFLQQNQISYIAEGALNNLYSLKLLVLGGNRLSFIPESVFQHLPSITTIDLSDNNIQRIHKRAFLTLPASTSTSGVTIQLSSNRIICDCNARALRDWKNSLGRNGNTLNTVTFSGFQCSNAQNIELDSLPDARFPSCNSTELSIFNRVQSCISCRRRDTHDSCDQVTLAGCRSSTTVCMTEVQIVNRKIQISKQCGSYSDCLQREQANARSCKVSHSSPISNMLCSFCCIGNNCNAGDVGGRTISYAIYLGLRIPRNFEPFMLDPTNAYYIRESVIYQQKIQEILLNSDGGYEVTFLSFRNEAPNTYVSLFIHTTSLNSVTLQGMISSIMFTVRNSQFYSQQNVAYMYVGTEMATAKKCVKEVTQTAVGLLTWPEVSVGNQANVACRRTSTGGTIYATRKCVKSSTNAAQWTAPDIHACQQSDTTRRLTELNNTQITSSNVNTVLNQLDVLTSDGADLTAKDVALTMDTVDKTMATRGVMNNVPALQSTVQVLSNMMDSSLGVLTEADRSENCAVRLLAVADQISAEGKLSAKGQLKVTTPNMVVAAVSVDNDNFDGLTLTAFDKKDGAFDGNDVTIEDGADGGKSNITRLVLPSSILSAAPGSRIAMKAMVTDKMFEAIRRSKAGRSTETTDHAGVVTRVNSHVLDASVVGQKVENLKDPVQMTFTHINKSFTNPRCVYWNTSQWEWSSRGCSLITPDSSKNVTTCHCDHLTNFALLMDVYGEGISLSARDSEILSVISYIGCGLSLLALVLTLVTYAMFKKLRRDNPSKILINLCVALALSNLVFVAGMHPYAMDSNVGCKIVAVVLHFSLLSALCWMAVEAFYMYLALVLVFKTYFTNFILKCSLVGWGIPLVIVAITLGVNSTENYSKLKTGMCWLEGVPFYAGFVGPVCLILVINFIAFGLVLRQIIGLKERKLSKSESITASQQLRGAIGVAILLGLTWIFAVFAIDKASVIFYYLFAIFNTLQGLWIFLFYCVLKKDARKAWKRALPCCDTVDDKSGILTTTRDKQNQIQSETGYRTKGTMKSGDSSSTGQHGVHSSSGMTASTSLSNSSAVRDSDVPYVNVTSNGTANYANKYTNMSKESSNNPSNGIEVTQTNHAHINLVFDDDGDSYRGKTSPRQAAGSAEYHNAVPKASSDRVGFMPPAYSNPHKTVDKGSPQNGGEWRRSPRPEYQKTPQKSSGADSGKDSQANIRQLHFKVGYTLSAGSSGSRTEESEVDSSTDKRVSVKDMINQIEHL